MNLFKINNEYIATNAREESFTKAILDTSKKMANLSSDDELHFDPYEYLVELLIERGFEVWDFFRRGHKEVQIVVRVAATFVYTHLQLFKVVCFKTDQFSS